MNDRYRWRGGSEHVLCHGPGSPMTLLVLPALFEEANRMRRLTVSVMRGLADQGIGTVLPDLPGTGESLVDLEDVDFADWLGAISLIAHAVGSPLRTVAIRGGALLDGTADFGWRLAPESGERLLRDLVRATALSSGQPAAAIDQLARLGPATLAGNRLAPKLYVPIAATVPVPGAYRVARLGDDAGACDVRLHGAKLWRAAEPGDDPALVSQIVTDIAAWTKTCATY